ncbi:grpE protein homolog, mitochondrial [Diachasma alloeum]|uniref:grpE protein homolog, mitochondrial n=1 Tax=Diachasma alloeum TaxID=454923 RepID=UPI0007382A93|nr:grpE protein homolog, mitochondrial [Diachasma alloeum]
MASMALPVASRFLRLTVDNFHQISRRTLLRSCDSTSVVSTQRHRYGTATEEKNAETSEDLSENEKKLKSEIDQLSKDIGVLKERNSELEDKYKRALAESENMRVRLTKQIEDAKLFGIQGFCKDLLDVADILGKATESVPKDQLTERNPHLKTLYEGLRMTESQLHKVFKKHGLVSLNPLDEKFNPNQHEALFQQEVEGKAPGTVVVVSKVGYKLHERIVRPALVGVSKA